MKKRSLIILTGAIMLLSACQDNNTLNGIDPIRDNSTQINFANYVGGMTRASKGVGATFVSGDEIAVYGLQNLDGEYGKIFNNQLVSNTGQEIWSYTPAKYWEKSSTYDFYAVYPYAVANSFDFDARKFSITDFTVADTARDQIDLMIAKQITDHQPYNVVNFEFSHILSNINFYVKASSEFNTDGIKSIEVVSFDVTGLYSKGSFAQNGWNANNVFTGAWTADATSVYDLPEVKNAAYSIGDNKAAEVATDLLLLPQQINDNAILTIKFKLVYSDDTESLFSRSVALNKIVGNKVSTPTDKVTLAKWEPNYRYNYTISVDPSITSDGGHFMPNVNPDHDQDELTNQDPENPITPINNIIEIDNDGDGITDEYWIDEDMDDTPDYPIIWDDIDGDGKEEALPDRDQDGQPDDSDEDGNPDVIWMDTDGDDIVDTELERPKTTPDVPSDPSDPDYPTEAFIDYDGGNDGGYENATAWVVTDENGDYFIDTDHDGKGDIPVVWKDVDGDGKLEGIADKDGDGAATENDNYDGDGVDYNGNPNDYDVILIKDKDDEGNTIWRELEKDPSVPEEEIVYYKTIIEFSATVTDWEDEYEASYLIK